MKSSLLLLLAQVFHLALPGYHYQFPRDHFNHPDYQIEWWYYTGNLQDATGHRFGFEVTFFRQAIKLPGNAAASEDPVWLPDQIYLAHLALSDIDRGGFYHTERLNRAGPGIAGSDIGSRKYWNGNWQAYWKSLETGEQQLQAVCDQFNLALHLNPKKGPVIHGQNGVSQKGPSPGDASHYISFTRIAASGDLTLGGRNFKLTGLAWMDHEFFTQQRNDSLSGWDWFAIQLDNDEELMLYRLRDKTGQPTSFSSGTYVDSLGIAHFLDSPQISFSPGGMWRSPKSGGNYPLAWQISVPSLGLQLSETASLENQELFTPDSVSPTYWEGAVTYQGTIHYKPAKGVGYLELTGYAEPLRLGH